MPLSSKLDRTVSLEPIKNEDESTLKLMSLIKTTQETNSTLKALISETQARLTQLEKVVSPKPLLPKLPQIKQFSGNPNEDFDLFQEDLINFVKREPYTPAQQLQILETYLQGDARYTFQALPPHIRSSFTDSLRSLKQIFACTSMHGWLEKLDQCKHEANEDYRVFAAKITRMVNHAYPVVEMTPMAIDSIKVSHFLKGINPDLAEMTS